jgi:hypothetical protein
MNRSTLIAAALALVAGLGGCEDRQGAPEAEGSCAGGKCDELTTGTGGEDGDLESRDSHGLCDGSTGSGGEGETETTGAAEPWDPDAVELICNARKIEAFNPNRMSFQPNFLRWSCLDTDGRLPTERRQEYCEYFAIVEVPDDDGKPGAPHVLGRNLGAENTDGQTPFGLDLTTEEIAALDADPDAIVGQCVFTSWNADVEANLPEREIQGEPLSAEVFQMKIDPNTRDAAACLVSECMGLLPPQEEVAPYGITLDDDFTRGCFLNSFINETHDRKSDSMICSAAMRLAECGCGLTIDAEVDEVLAQSDTLGFRLGSWDDASEAKAPCEHVSLGEGDNHNLVVCPITAAQLANNHAEVKAFCQETYADEVVVHVDITPQAVLCTPEPAADDYAASCSAEPWVIEK